MDINRMDMGRMAGGKGGQHRDKEAPLARFHGTKYDFMERIEEKFGRVGSIQGWINIMSFAYLEEGCQPFIVNTFVTR